MSYKSDKLAQKISQLHEYIASKDGSRAEIKEINREMDKMAETLKTGKLVINIISAVPEGGARIEKYLSSHQELVESYLVRVVESDESEFCKDDETPPQLILQNAEASPARQTCYRLVCEQQLTVGRDPKRANLLIADSFNAVSGSHACFKTAIEGEKLGNQRIWQVSDQGSRNGTFVNGEKVSGSRVLRSGDRIVLGGPSPGSRKPEFVFECRQTDQAAGDGFDRRFSDCDALFIVTTNGQHNPEVIQRLVEKTKPENLSERFVIAGDSDSSLSEIEDKLEEAIASLAALANRKEDILVNRLTARFNEQIMRLDALLIAEEEKLKSQQTKEEEKLSGNNVDELRERAKMSLRQAIDEKDNFIRQVRIDLGTSKVSALDSFNKRSLISKIQAFTDELRPTVATKNGAKFIRLAAPSKNDDCDVAAAAFHLCQTELEKWVAQEWEKVINSYGGGGLRKLYQKVESILTVSSSAFTIDSVNQPLERRPVNYDLQESIMPGTGESLLREESLVSHVFKNFRSSISSLVSLIGLAAFIVPMFKSQGSPAASSQTSQGAAPTPTPRISKAEIINAISSNYPLKVAALLTMIAGVAYIIYSYQVSQRLNRDELGDRLRKELQSYYQSYAKDRIERLVQGLALSLEAEDKRLKNYFERVSDQLSGQVVEMRKRLDEIKARQVSIARERMTIKALGR